MKRLTRADFQNAVLEHCHEQTRIADAVSGKQSERCEEPCASCMSAMRKALQFIGGQVGFVVNEDEPTAMH